ncbi:helix-turn-helix domain-containing protein [Lactiplantibacillus plantarum]|uniref:helix-turn-helix domain-containing protein n=1 Tax=Lactiplantibacillus plantarum TaxID=1590 RepID=UPI0009352CED|nr:helix-turn-helix domain-containing protein [Lactiplantibacillus plantarum]
MTKFNLDFRIKIVTEYLSGKGSTSLARAYGISTHSIILDWVHRFDRRDIKGLKDRSMFQEYSSQFKVGVLNWKKQNRASLPVTALHFDLSLPSTIWQWERRFKRSGIAGLERKQGNSKNKTKHKQNKPQPAKTPTPVAELKQENHMVKIEN